MRLLVDTNSIDTTLEGVVKDEELIEEEEEEDVSLTTAERIIEKIVIIVSKFDFFLNEKR